MKDAVLHLKTLKQGLINEIKSHIQMNDLNVLELEGIGLLSEYSELVHEIISIDNEYKITVVDEFQNDYEMNLDNLTLYDLASIVDYINTNINI